MAAKKTEGRRKTKQPDTPLQKFLKSNPGSSLKIEGRDFVVEKPWDDDSLELRFPKTNQKMISALNNTVLPYTFDAIYHTDTKGLEFIFTVFNSGEESYMGRNFTFNLDGIDYKCEFGDVSDRLLLIASRYKRVGPSPKGNNFRNLPEFAYFNQLDKEKKERLKPVSFWIRNIVWDTEKLERIARLLNFYTHYFDTFSPIILLHEKQTPPDNGTEVQFLFGDFPSKISAHVINPYLLGLWRAAVDSEDSFLEFLYYYQIIEHVAFYYLNNDTLQKINRILLAPHVEQYVNKASADLIEVITKTKLSDSEKFDLVMDRYIDADLLWKAIEPLKEGFSTELKFDGDFRIPPVIKKDTTLVEFKGFGVQKISQQMRGIRNAIAHARDTKTLSVIEPSELNSTKLDLWTKLLGVIASQIMICGPSTL